MRAIRREVLLLLLALFLLGCDAGGASDSAKGKVSGIVNLDSKPLPAGMILFDPQDGTGPTSIEIIDGKYEGEVKPGRNLVMISATKKVPMVGAEADESAMSEEETLPARYNSESKDFREVKKEGENKIDFNLKSR